MLLKVLLLATLFVSVNAAPRRLTPRTLLEALDVDTNLLHRRQSTTGLTDLLALVYDGRSSGECVSECDAWYQETRDCTNVEAPEGTTGCICQDSNVADAEPCGACFDSEGVTAYNGYKELCLSLESIGLSSSSSSFSLSSRASSTSSRTNTSTSSRSTLNIPSLTLNSPPTITSLPTSLFIPSGDVVDPSTAPTPTPTAVAGGGGSTGMGVSVLSHMMSAGALMAAVMAGVVAGRWII